MLREGSDAPLSLSRSVAGDVAQLLRTARQAGLEGLVAKRKGSPYVAGRSGHWLKLRFDRRQDCAIAGWIALSGTTSEVGALLLAVVDAGRLVFAGRVGTGFDTRTRCALAKRLTDEAGPAAASPRRIQGLDPETPSVEGA